MTLRLGVSVEGKGASSSVMGFCAGGQSATEVHLGGGGCVTVHNNWSEAVAWSELVTNNSSSSLGRCAIVQGDLPLG